VINRDYCFQTNHFDIENVNKIITYATLSISRCHISQCVSWKWCNTERLNVMVNIYWMMYIN